MDNQAMGLPKMTYPLLPYSQVVYDGMLLHGDAPVRTFIFRADTRSIDVVQLHIALEKTLRCFGVFEMDVDAQGRQYRVARENILEGPFHEVKIDEDGNTISLSIRINRILGDEISLILFMQTLDRYYHGGEPAADGYWEWIEAVERRKTMERYAEHRKMLSEKFDLVNYPVAPMTDTQHGKDGDGLLMIDLQEFEQEIEIFKQDWLLSLNGLMIMATGLAIMDMEGTDKAGLTWAYDGRVTEQELHIFGSLHRDVPIMLERDELGHMIRQTRQKIREGIRLSDYPYTLTAPKESIWHKAVNVIVEPSRADLHLPAGITVEELQSDEHVHLDVEVFENPLRMQLRYDTACYTEQRIAEFAQQIKENVRKILDFHAHAIFPQKYNLVPTPYRV